VQKDIARSLPRLLPDVRISLYDVAPHILGTFDAKLAAYAEKKFRRGGIEIKTNHHVERVEAVGRLHSAISCAFC
jgi:NADH dehydrogenase FAD-containing subunit